MAFARHALGIPEKITRTEMSIKHKKDMKKEKEKQMQPEKLQETATTLPSSSEATSTEVVVTNPLEPATGDNNTKEMVVEPSFTAELVTDESPTEVAPEADSVEVDSNTDDGDDDGTLDVETADGDTSNNGDDTADDSEEPVSYDAERGCYHVWELYNSAPERVPCLLDPVLPKVGLAACVGTSDVGKSTLMRQLALFVAAGLKWFLGWAINARHKSAIIVSSEDSPMNVGSLLRRQVPGEIEEANLRFIFRTDNLLDNLHTELTNDPADLVVVDTFVDVFQNDMNDVGRVRGFLQGFHELANEHGCAIIFVHHSNKQKLNSVPTKHSILGSQGFEAKLRVIWEIREGKDDFHRNLCILKGNYISNDLKSRSFELGFTENLQFESTGNRLELTSLVRTEANPKIAKCVELKKQGKKQIDIATELGVDAGTVSKWLKSARASGEFSDDK
jgi:hypothetical protein